MVVKLTIKGNVTESDYDHAVEMCLDKYGPKISRQIKLLIVKFCEVKKKLRCNFKFRLYTNEQKMLSFNVGGGSSWGLKKKYKVNEDGVTRYDIFNKILSCVPIIGNVYNACLMICTFFPEVNEDGLTSSDFWNKVLSCFPKLAIQKICQYIPGVYEILTTIIFIIDFCKRIEYEEPEVFSIFSNHLYSKIA